MVSIFKQEKGAAALKKLQAQTQVLAGGRAKVVGGAKLKRGSKAAEKATKSGDVKRIAERISKFTPGGKSSTAAKRSA